MACVWSGSIRELKEVVRAAKHVDVLTTEYRRLYGAPPPSVVESWRSSLPALMAELTDTGLDSLQVLVELEMPMGAERADLVIIGGTEQVPRAFVLELKQWSACRVLDGSSEVEVPGFGLHQHPAEQVLNYVGKLKLFHSVAGTYDLAGGVFLHNMDAESKAALLRCSPDQAVIVPLWSSEDGDTLATALREWLVPCSLSPDAHTVFAAAGYEQTRHLFDVVARHGPAIARRATAALAEQGVGLTGEQDLIVEEALRTVRDGRKRVFIVRGGPGSGKTLLAITLLLRALHEGRSCALAIRNNRLQAILRKCFDSSYRGASGTMLYFEPRSGTGIGSKNFTGSFDLLICDEAQRMSDTIMPTVLGRGTVSVIFLDETQRLNPPEKGTVDAFCGASQAIGKPAIERTLTAAVRCRGGEAYHRWVEALLQNPGRDLALRGQTWRQKYDFQVMETPEALIRTLAEYRSITSARVAMVASFTESPGNERRTSPDNLRIGYPLTSGWDGYRGHDISIPWLMRKEEYVRFWLERGSNSLTDVASIYGSQGFESDHVGVFWGRDLVLRYGRWTLGDPNTCYDTIEGLVSRGKTRRWASDALTLVINRYRIFLTRGITGTLIYCEDRETRETLQSLLTE